jgi:hypothetical protein
MLSEALQHCRLVSSLAAGRRSLHTHGKVMAVLYACVSCVLHTGSHIALGLLGTLSQVSETWVRAHKSMSIA